MNNMMNNASFDTVVRKILAHNYEDSTSKINTLILTIILFMVLVTHWRFGFLMGLIEAFILMWIFVLCVLFSAEVL